MPITLPIHEWFTADFDFQTGLGNRYSGSVGTDGSTGSLGRTLFEYNAVMCRTEEQDADGGKRKTVTLHVACGIRRSSPMAGRRGLGRRAEGGFSRNAGGT